MNHLRNMTIGLVDGLSIPFALAAGLSAIVSSSRTIAVACVAVIIAWSITMTGGAYLSAKKHEPEHALPAAIAVGAGYILGGIITALPFYFIAVPRDALKYSAVVTLVALFAAGYMDSRAHLANGWVGGIRILLTGAIAAAAAYAVAGLFR